MAEPRSGRGRYIALDGLRGVAALGVLYLHGLVLFSRLSIGPPALAVDFFFMLSGFVIAHAYGHKLDHELGWSQFMTFRVLRLYPMLFLGVALGGLWEFARHHPGPNENIATFVGSLFALPIGLLYVGKHYPYDSPNVFPFNGVLWSLFFAVIASAVYGTPIRYFGRGTLAWSFIFCSALLIAASIWAGSVSELGRHGLIGFFGGFPRVAVSFTMGASIYSLGTFKRFPPMPFAVPAMVLAALLVTPIGDSWASDLTIIFVVFPLLLCAGAQAPGGELCAWWGRLSYPLYLVQWPVCQAVGYVVRTRITSDPVVLVTAAMLSSILFAWVALVLYDQPIQRRLGRWLKASSRYAFSSAATAAP